MDTIDFLLIDDEQEQEEILQNIFDSMNGDGNNYILRYKAVKNINEAIIALYQNNFHAIIIDLNLDVKDASQTENENITGNILLKQIIDKEIIPIVVRTGLLRFLQLFCASKKLIIHLKKYQNIFVLVYT